MKHWKQWLILMVCALMLCPSMVVAEEEEVVGEATPAMEMSLEEAALASETEVPAEMPEVSMEPFVPENAADKLILGADDRVTIGNNRVYPYSAIAYMEAEADCGCDWTGTAFMVSKRTAMTAAHCVVCPDHGRPMNSIVLYFGYRSHKDYLYRYNGATRFWYGTTFQNSDGSYGYDGHLEWDYAYIRLEENVGDTTGWFGLTSHTDTEIDYAWHQLTGYRDGLLKSSLGYSMVKNDYLVSYNNDMLPGNSGCPVYTDDYYVVAINIAHNDAKQENYGRRITWSLINEMRDNNLFD